MRIRQIRLDHWGSLTGLFSLDAGRVPLLVVDNDRELADLATGIDAVLSHDSASEGPGSLEADLDQVDRKPGVSTFSTRGRTPVPSALAPTDGEAFTVRSPWLIRWSALEALSGPSQLSGWLQQMADSDGGPRQTEDVRRQVEAALNAHRGLLVVEGSVDQEIAKIDLALAQIASSAGSLATDRRLASVAISRLLRVRRVTCTLEPPVRAMEY
ncbi:MAG: hypothetical protein HY815_20235, partial [Candidatus Riflebacteria bacterium]|nr:hypothetical protein [Candidatus Riflebacteria bacterium]